MFEQWWAQNGHNLSGQFKKELSQFAYEAGRKAGMTEAGNYTADSVDLPKEINFSNGRRVKLQVSHDGTAYLTVGKF